MTTLRGRDRGANRPRATGLVAIAAAALFLSAESRLHATPAVTPASTRLAPGGGSGSSGFTTRVRFANHSPFRRTEWGLVTVPFPEGVFQPGDSFGVSGMPCDMVPFGAPWSDGSVRFAQLCVPLDLDGGEEVELTVGRLAPAPHQFTASSWVQKVQGSFKVRVVVVLPDGTLSHIEPTLQSTLVNTSIRRTKHYRSRLPRTHLVADLWLTEFSGQDHMSFELRLTSSDPQSQGWLESIDSAHLWVEGAAAHVRGARRRGAGYGHVTPDGPNVVHLLGQTNFYDGQGQEWTGELLFYHPTGAPEPSRADTLMAAIDAPLFGVSTDWDESGAFGPFGYVPPPPPWVLDGGRGAAIARRQAFDQWCQQPGRPFDDLPLGLRESPGATGAQPDFGAAKLLHIFASGMPDGIDEARFNATEEAVRPVHHREVDGSPVRAANHPQWIALAGRTHYDMTMSPDRLGKPGPEPWPQTQGWFGRDNQHWSSLTLASTYLLTASPSLRYELDNEAELYIASHTLPSEKPGYASNGMDASRAVGRTLLSMSWNYLLTDNQALHTRVSERARQVYYPWAAGQGVTGPVQPMTLAPPDPRQLMVENWKPWEESQAVIGLEAAAQAFRVNEYHDLAVMTARTVMMHGWKVTPTETIIATAIGWKPNGQALTAAELGDPNWVLWSYGTNFNLWGLSSVKLAHSFGQMYGDTALENRAQQVLQYLEGQRNAPASGGWDEFAGWEAVR